MSQSRKRRQWSAADRMRIVLAGMEAGTEISAESLELNKRFRA